MYRLTSLPVVLALSISTLLLGAALSQAQEGQAFVRTRDVIYGRKHGMALTFDVFAPKEGRNGAGVIWVVSGGWVSAHIIAEPQFPFSPITELVKRGYSVFAVVHGSQPKFTIPEILEDMHRAVRFIRSHAADYGVDPDRLGITGGSAGGHLSLMQGTLAKQGDTKAKDPVERVSSRVQAVACYFPPTDFLNYGKPGENALGCGILKDFKAPFAFQELDARRGKFGEFVPVTDEAKILAIGKQISPAYHVTADDAPTLIIHGDKDFLVPIQQAELIVGRFKDAGVPARLVVKQGAGHGWADVAKDMPTIVDWFDEHLKRK
jgi:acetyl esterase/lipase